MFFGSQNSNWSNHHGFGFRQHAPQFFAPVAGRDPFPGFTSGTSETQSSEN